MPGPGALAAIVVKRGDAHQLGDFALVEHASLRQGRWQGGRQHWSNAWSGWAYVIGLPPGGAGADAPGDFCVGLLNQALEVVNMP